MLDPVRRSRCRWPRRVGFAFTALVALSTVSSACASAASRTTRLTVRVAASPGAPMTTRGTLRCAPDSGTGAFRTPRASRAACLALNRSGGFAGALQGRRPDACGNVFAGDDVATIAGTYRGRSVNITITRGNSCELATWIELESVLGLPAAR